MLYCYICDYIAVALILFFFSVWIWFCRIHNIYFLVSFLTLVLFSVQLFVSFCPNFLINTFSADFKIPVTETKLVNFL